MASLLTRPGALSRPVIDEAVSQLVANSAQRLVIVEDEAGQGSGFVYKADGQVWLATNTHVVAGMKSPRFTTLDRKALRPGVASAAVGHDLLRFNLTGAEMEPFEVLQQPETNAAIGDEVIVLGNSDGARVVTTLMGRLVGIGPNLVEVDAEFVPGNSGSPIIHKKTGKVIGIATYLVARDMEFLSGGMRTKQIRRFGYRLDSVQQWQPVNWQVFHGDRAQLEKVEAVTRDLVQLLRDMRQHRNVFPSKYQNMNIRRAAESFLDVAMRNGVSATDRMANEKNFMAAMRSISQTDIKRARDGVRYDYYRRALDEEQGVRDQFFKVFDRLVKSATEQPGRRR